MPRCDRHFAFGHEEVTDPDIQDGSELAQCVGARGVAAVLVTGNRPSAAPDKYASSVTLTPRPRRRQRRAEPEKTTFGVVVGGVVAVVTSHNYQMRVGPPGAPATHDGLLNMSDEDRGVSPTS